MEIDPALSHGINLDHYWSNDFLNRLDGGGRNSRGHRVQLCLCCFRDLINYDEVREESAIIPMG